MLDWLGIGGETIERVPRDALADGAPRSTSARGSRCRAMRSSPPRSAAPTRVYEAGDRVTFLYRQRPARGRASVPEVLLDAVPRPHARDVRPQAGRADTRIDRVTVQGEPGFWLSGASHSLLYEEPNGTVRDVPARLAGPTLVWRHGDRTLRLEADVTKSRALAIARSIP